MANALISGAGPIGLTLAIELARYGVPVRIVDKAPARTDKSKALVIWSRTLELLDRARLRRAFVAPGSRAVARQLSGHERRSMPISPDSLEHALSLRPDDPAERDRARARGAPCEIGVSVERSVETRLRSRTTATASTARPAHAPTAASETSRADWLVGCDGATATTRHGLGLDFEGSTQHSDWCLADVHLDGRAPHDESCTSAGTATASSPSSRSRGSLAHHRRPRPGRGQQPPADPTLEEVQALVDRAARRRLHDRGSGLARRLPHQRAQGARTTAAAASSSPATPRTSTARPAARA